MAKQFNPLKDQLNSYYETQLKKMSGVGVRKIKVINGFGETHWFDLNNESASILVKWLNDHYEITK